MLRTIHGIGPRAVALALAAAFLAGAPVGAVQVEGASLQRPPSTSVTSEARPLTLREAISQARRQSPDVLAARARADAASQLSRAAGAYRWPTVGVEAGAVRSDDPVAAFGGRLRQGRFTQQDFDPAALNHPDAVTDWSGAVGASWTPLDFSADAALRASRAEAEAAGLGAAWAERAAGFRAEWRYLEAVGSAQRLAAAESAARAAEANADRAESRHAQGLLTDADVLQARAALEGARAHRVDARRAVDDALGRLAVAIGWPEGVTPVPTDTALGDMNEGGMAERGALEGRADLRASMLGVRAAEARLEQAKRSRLPTLGGFARLATHAPKAFDGTESDWTVGFQVRIPVFTGFAVSAMAGAAAAARDAADHEHTLRLREARVEVAEARRAVDAARQGARAAQAAASAAHEAARLMRRRFEEGLITTADLLAVEAQASALETQAVNARLGVELARARLAFLSWSESDDSTGDVPDLDMNEGTDQGWNR